MSPWFRNANARSITVWVPHFGAALANEVMKVFVMQLADIQASLARWISCMQSVAQMRLAICYVNCGSHEDDDVDDASIMKQAGCSADHLRRGRIQKYFGS
nr:hypothetical protein CFP56_16902 [Quercus suber]